MQRLFLILCALLISTSLFGQDLIHSRRSSYFTFIYKIDNEQAEAVYKDIRDINDAHFTHLFDFFPTDFFL